jgi:hypothetical protein
LAAGPGILVKMDNLNENSILLKIEKSVDMDRPSSRYSGGLEQHFAEIGHTETIYTVIPEIVG